MRRHTAAGSGPRARFSRDRAGAVVAAVNLLARVTPNNQPAIFGPTLRDQVVGDDGPVFLENISGRGRLILPAHRMRAFMHTSETENHDRTNEIGIWREHERRILTEIAST